MGKPSLASLMAALPGKAKRKAVARAAAPAAQERPAEMARALLVRRFVTAYLRENLNGSAAFRAIRPDVTSKSSRVLACEMLQCDDVRAELFRQLRGLSTHADLDEAWVYRQWRSMAEANIYDYIVIEPTTGVATLNMGREQLTLEQQLNVRRLKFDPKTGRVVDLELADRKGAVDSVAKARNLFRELEKESTERLAEEIAERMRKAAKLVPQVRTFDNETGEEIE